MSVCSAIVSDYNDDVSDYNGGVNDCNSELLGDDGGVIGYIVLVTAE